MDAYPGGQSDWTTILTWLKSEDEMDVYQGAMQLRDALSYAQENQMHGFATEQYMDILVKIVTRDAITDLSNEVKFFAIQCLTTLMDIFPSLVNALVQAGLLKGMTNVMNNSMGFIDLAEACIKAYEKIAVENPPAVLKCGAVGSMLEQMPFFEMGTQLRIFRIIQRIARHSSSEDDFDTHILPVIPFLCMSIGPDTAISDPKKMEDGAKIISEIQESFCLFYSPLHDFTKISAQFDKLLSQGVYDVILENLRQYAEVQNKIDKASQQMDIDTNEIDSQPKSQVLTHPTVVYFFKILDSAAKYSHQVANKLFGESTLLRDLSVFLPIESRKANISTKEYPLVNEVICILQSVFSEKQDNKINDTEIRKQRVEYDTKKREYQTASERRNQLAGVAEQLLPRVFSVYEVSINPQFRIKTLQLIDKIISLLDHELLKNFIEPNQFANFVLQILRSRHSSSIEVCLQISRKVLDCSPMTYSVPFMREGVSQFIAELSSEQKIKSFLGISESTDISDKAFDLDIHETKEALQYARSQNPDDHSMRDFYERRLLELVERQKHPPGKVRMKKSDSQAKKSEESPKKEEEKKPNLAMRIINQSQDLLKDFFENQTFLEKLRGHSQQTKVELGLLDQLTQLATDLSLEAAQLQLTPSQLSGIRTLLVKVGELLTLESSAITSYEFKQSGLLWALELLLTKSPSQAKVAMEEKRAKDTGEEQKRAEEIDMQEAQKQSKQLSKKEGRCVILRLKHVAYALLQNTKHGRSPLRALLELNHKVVSENDSVLVSAPQGKNAPSAFSREMAMGNILGGGQGQGGDYDHCINALKQLQKRVTVVLIYDPKRDQMKHKELPMISEKSNEVKSLNQPGDFPDFADSQMEDESHDPNSSSLEPAPMKKKGVSHHPALMNLAGSPNKKDTSAIEKHQINQSKVYLKRHQLYSDLTQIPVTVEQSTCLQLLEDFLRNKVRTADQVKGLKMDYGFSGFGGPPGGASGSLFGGQYQSISQKILRKSLGANSCKLLDAANEKLIKILNTGAAVYLKTRQKHKKPAKIDEEGSENDMEGIEDAEKSEKEEKDSDDYSDMDEDEEEELEAMEIEKQNLLDEFVEEFPDQIISADIPEEEQQTLAKILTRQHTFMIDQLKVNMESDLEEHDVMDEDIRQEEMERLEERLEDFQETMERVHSRFIDKFAEKKESKKPTEEEKQSEASKIDTIIEKDEDHEMIDQSEEVELSLKSEEIQLKKQPGVKLADEEMEKPADDKESVLKEFDLKQKRIEKMIDQELSENAIEKEKMLQEKIQSIQQTIKEKGRVEDDNEISEQTQEIMSFDLEELIAQQGEDCDFEFYYEGKQIQPNQSMFEVIKDSEKQKDKTSERVTASAEKIKFLQSKELELKKKARLISEAKGKVNEEEIAELKKDISKLKDMMNVIYSEIGHSMKPGGFFGSLNAHKIYFAIKDKTNDFENMKRQRLDSLAELTNSALLKRSRTKSEAVKDISSGAINKFVEQLIGQEFKIFDDEMEDEKETEKKDTTLPQVDEEMTEEDNQIISKDKVDEKQELKDKLKKRKQEETDQLRSALTILKVFNYLYSHQDLICEKGIRLIMKQNKGEEEGSQSPEKQSIDEQNTISDIELRSGFNELQVSTFYHNKLDSYLLRSIKDPYNLVQGAISPKMQAIFQKCPFLFPFSTKQLYFKLVSFISAVDVHRGIYFLRQTLRKSGASKLAGHDKDNLKKIAKQKVLIHRDKLIQSAMTLIQKIDKRSFLEFEFQGEEGVGLGPTLEFYDNIAEEFKLWNVKTSEEASLYMWRTTEDNLLFPSPICLSKLSPEIIKQVYEVFRLCGTIVAKAIVDDRQIDLPISPLFWRLCLGAQLSIFDMQKLDETVFNTLAEFSIVANKAAEIEKRCEAKKLGDEVRERQLQSLTISNGSHVEDYALAFTMPCYDEIELIQGGKDRGVDLENAQDYVDLVLHYTFHETIKLQVQAFRKGFNAIFPISSLAPFTHSSSEEGELETMVCGIRCDDPEWRSQENMMKVIEPAHGYTRNSDQYKYFIKYINELEPANRPNFLKFLSGSRRLPIGGFKSLSPNLSFVLKEGNPGQQPDQILPSVMTCQNYVKSPRYSNYQVFKHKFDYAVAEGNKNFTLT